MPGSSSGQLQCCPGVSVEDAATATAAALSRAEVLLAYEATFTTEHFVARADAVRRNGRAWDLVEVKSGKLPEGMDPKRLKSDSIDDIAFTTFVARNAGLAIERCVLILLRPDYGYGMPTSELLGEIDVTDLAMARARESSGLAPQAASHSSLTTSQSRR